jgi:hypothetical protein
MYFVRRVLQAYPGSSMKPFQVFIGSLECSVDKIKGYEPKGQVWYFGSKSGTLSLTTPSVKKKKKKKTTTK